MQDLQTDFIRFGGLHSWYKHIPLLGNEDEKTIYFRKQKGVQEPKYSEAEDDSEHWWFFIEEKPEDDDLGSYYKAVVGPMLSSAKLLENPKDENFNSSMHIIKSNNPLFEEWLKENYPEEYKTSTMEDLMFFDPGRKICLSECKKYLDNLLSALDFVKKLIRL